MRCVCVGEITPEKSFFIWAVIGSESTEPHSLVVNVVSTRHLVGAKRAFVLCGIALAGRGEWSWAMARNTFNPSSREADIGVYL